jgi:hypothetical protein
MPMHHINRQVIQDSSIRQQAALGQEERRETRHSATRAERLPKGSRCSTTDDPASPRSADRQKLRIGRSSIRHVPQTMWLSLSISCRSGSI